MSYAPIADIARIYRVSQRTARRWARDDGWRREGALYSLADAQASWERREAWWRVQGHLGRKYGHLAATGTGT